MTVAAALLAASSRCDRPEKWNTGARAGQSEWAPGQRAKGPGDAKDFAPGQRMHKKDVKGHPRCSPICAGPSAEQGCEALSLRRTRPLKSAALTRGGFLFAAGLISRQNGVMTVRPPEASELDHLAQLWHDGLAGRARACRAGRADARAHAGTLSRAARRAAGDTVWRDRVGAPDGLLHAKGDELYQFYVARSARGSGAAAPDGCAEAELAPRGVKARCSIAASAMTARRGSTRSADG